MELLGQVPIESTVAAGSDAGEPVVLTGTGLAAQVFSQIAARIIEDTPDVDDMAGCSARDAEVAEVGVTVRRTQDHPA